MTRRVVLLVVAALLTAAAALAIAILLFGDFGSTEGRILATTALLAGYGLLALPAAILRDRRRAPALTAVVLALVAAAASLAIAAVWTDSGSDELGKLMGAVNGWLVASVQWAALTLRSGRDDTRLVRVLFVASSALAAVLALMVTVLLWAGIGSERYGRAFGSLLVLNVLLVALQPLLARARPRTTTYRLRVRVATDEAAEVTVEAPDLAAAAAKAIGLVERAGTRVVGLDVQPNGSDARDGAPPSGRSGRRAARGRASAAARRRSGRRHGAGSGSGRGVSIRERCTVDLMRARQHL
jgi:hypothetical protein